jgi:uncharacterized damage-inducible protein DinB
MKGGKVPFKKMKRKRKCIKLISFLLLFLLATKHRMIHHYLPKTVSVLERLDQDTLWTREVPRQNPIGSIVLHICEHVRRSRLSLSSPDTRFERGIEEYFPDGNRMAPDALIRRIKQDFSEWEKALSKRIELAAQEKEPISETDFHRLYHLVEHTGYHVGQIIDRAQRITGHSFQFVQNGIHERQLQELVTKDLFEWKTKANRPEPNTSA